MGEYITLGKLAEELGMDKSNLRKYIKDKTDFNFLEVRIGQMHSSLLCPTEYEIER
jgi:AraC-like DNA-binding protein